MASYLKYVFRNTEALRIADNSISQRGQTGTLRFIPGSTIRGMIINSLTKEADFDYMKPILFSERISFMNAYLSTKARTLIPSPKGFYEDKCNVEGKKAIQNVVIDGSFNEGLKRASLGRFCYLEQDCIHYYGVKTGSEMRIRIGNNEEDRAVFRNDYIMPGQYFEGYIRLSGDEKTDKHISEIIKENSELILGNARSSGMGKCVIVEAEKSDAIPYLGKGFAAPNDAYMMLLSDTALRSELGEICGFDPENKRTIECLEKVLGVRNLEFKYASSSVRKVHGYNRTWGTHLPTYPVYEAGSVIHLSYSGEISAEVMERICDSGIGIRRNEGFGRILFLKNYEDIKYKLYEEYCWEKEDPAAKGDVPNIYKLKDFEKETLKAAARGYYVNALQAAAERYILTHPIDKGGVSSSLLGDIEARLELFRYNPTGAARNIKDYFGHIEEKEGARRIHNDRSSSEQLRRQIEQILNSSLFDTLFKRNGSNSPFKKEKTVMGVPIEEFFTKEEEARYKIKLLVSMIRYKHKEK